MKLIKAKTFAGMDMEVMRNTVLQISMTYLVPDIKQQVNMNDTRVQKYL